MDLESKVAELEKRVKKLENTNKMRIVFSIVSIVLAAIIIILIFYFLGRFYDSLLEENILLFF